MPRRVAEVLEPGPVPLWRHPEWSERFPDLAQGTTGRGQGAQSFDLGLSGRAPVGEVLARWRRLGEATGLRTTVHARQVHGAEVAAWPAPLPPGLLLVEGMDAHVATLPDILLAISVADCVPIFLTTGSPGAVGMIHAGWRGVAAGILEASVERLAAEAGIGPADLWLHCGPSICGECYEVGPEVHAAVNPGASVPAGPTPIDLRAALSRRAAALGIAGDRITISAHCTLCGPGSFFSHRGGSPDRQMGVIGWRTRAPRGLAR